MSDTATPSAPSNPAAAAPAAPAETTISPELTQAVMTPQQPAAPTGELPDISTLFEGQGQLTEAQLSALESGSADRIAEAFKDRLPAAPESPQAETQPEESAQTQEAQPDPTGEQQTQEPEQPQTTAQDRPQPQPMLERISVRTIPEAQREPLIKLTNLMRQGKTMEQAIAEVMGFTAAPTQAPAVEQPATQPQQPAPAPAATTQTAPQVQELETQLATLQAQYKRAKESFDPAATDILEQMTDIKMDLRDARREAQAEQERMQTFQQQEQQSINRVYETYDEYFKDPKFEERIGDEKLLASAKNDPVMMKPDWAEKIAQRVIEKFYPKAGVQNPAAVTTAQTTTIPAAPKNTVRLPGSPVGAGHTAGALSPQTALAEMETLSPDMAEAVMLALAQTVDKPQR